MTAATGRSGPVRSAVKSCISSRPSSSCTLRSASSSGCLAWATTVAWPADQAAVRTNGRCCGSAFSRRRSSPTTRSGFRGPAWAPTTTTPSITPLGPLAAGQVVYLGVVAAAVTDLARGRLGLSAARWDSDGCALRWESAEQRSRSCWSRRSPWRIAHRPRRVAGAPASERHSDRIDSLRLDQLQRFGGRGVTKHLDRFLAEADIVRDTTTPVARTYPSWTAILTGRSPLVTGARFNLAPRETRAGEPDHRRRAA